MKQLLFMLTLLITLSSFGQKQKATLFFKDGKTLDGYASFYGSQKIKFKKTKDSDYIIYSSAHLNKIIIRVNDFDSEYHYKQIKSKNKFILLEVLKEGSVTLYKHSGYFHALGFDDSVGMGNRTLYTYYASREFNDLAENLGSTDLIYSKNFKKTASKYFKDCPELVKKIKAKEFRKRDIVEVVEYYNENCGQ